MQLWAGGCRTEKGTKWIGFPKNEGRFLPLLSARAGTTFGAMATRSFLVISKPRKGSRVKVPVEKLRKAAESLRAALNSGSIEAAYAMVSGGAVYVFRSPSRDALERQLQRHPLGQVSDVTIMEVVDSMKHLGEDSSEK